MIPSPTFVWISCGSISLILFIIWAQRPEMPVRGLAASVGAISCLVSLSALTQIARAGNDSTSLLVSVAFYTVGIGFSLICSFFYAFLFMFWHAKNF